MLTLPIIVFSAVFLLVMSEFSEKKKEDPKSSQKELGDAIARYLTELEKSKKEN